MAYLKPWVWLETLDPRVIIAVYGVLFVLLILKLMRRSERE